MPTFSAKKCPARDLLHLDKGTGLVGQYRSRPFRPELVTIRKTLANPCIPGKEMTFLQLLQALEERLGHVQLPLRSKAASVHEIFEGCGLHHELALTLVRAIYTKNRCHHLKDEVMAETSLRAIAPIHAAVLQAQHTDIDTYRFLETFVANVQAVFGQEPGPRPIKPEAKRGCIVPFPVHRRQAR